MLMDLHVAKYKYNIKIIHKNNVNENLKVMNLCVELCRSSSNSNVGGLELHHIYNIVQEKIVCVSLHVLDKIEHLY